MGRIRELNRRIREVFCQIREGLPWLGLSPRKSEYRTGRIDIDQLYRRSCRERRRRLAIRLRGGSQSASMWTPPCGDSDQRIKAVAGHPTGSRFDADSQSAYKRAGPRLEPRRGRYGSQRGRRREDLRGSPPHRSPLARPGQKVIVIAQANLQSPNR